MTSPRNDLAGCGIRLFWEMINVRAADLKPHDLAEPAACERPRNGDSLRKCALRAAIADWQPAQASAGSQARFRFRRRFAGRLRRGPLQDRWAP